MGNIRGCSWTKALNYGNILQQDINDILNSPVAKELRNSVVNKTYDYCSVDNCPYLIHNTIDEHSIEWNGEDIEYPHALYIGHDGVCNYRCTCCTSHKHMERKEKVAIQADILLKNI